MQNKRKVKERLEPVQLQHWVRAVQSGNAPTIKDPDTQQNISLPMPLARSDGDGLTFTLSHSGTSAWILRYRYGGRSRELTIGNYPDIGLAEARKIAREKRAEIDRGGDPAADKRKAITLAYQDWTVRRLVEDYRQKVLIGLGNSTQRSYERNLKRIEVRLGALAVSTITSLDIVWLIEDVGVRWVESNMLLCTAKMLFRHAAGKRLIPSNPCAGIELAALKGKRPPIKRRLMLSNDELRVLLNASMSRENLLTVKILLGTAVRSDELRNAKWEQIDFDNGIWNVPSTKTGPGMHIPLSTPVKAWFLELKPLSDGSEFVLPARAGSRHIRFGGDAPINPNTLGAAIDFWLDEHKPKVRRFTPHDLRSTAKSHMRALGVPRDITEMCLNHKLPGVEGIYDLHTYFDERKEALTRWGDFLTRIESASSANEEQGCPKL
jgi:integrase